MLKHPNYDTTESKITNAREEDYTPNAVDVRLGKVFQVSNNTFVLGDDVRQHRDNVEILPQNGWWSLEPGSYEVAFENYVTVGPNEAGFVVPRSSLIRNGVLLNSGLYDSGYSGSMGALLVVTSGAFHVQKGTRVGQYLVYASDQAKMLYQGAYGEGTEHELKYKGKKTK